MPAFQCWSAAIRCWLDSEASSLPIGKGKTMTEPTFTSLHSKLDFLLQDHGVSDFDASGLDLASNDSLHAKANALCSAHGGDPSTMNDETLEQLQPKLDFLIKGHGVEFSNVGMDPSSLKTVDAKLDAIVGAHEAGHE